MKIKHIITLFLLPLLLVGCSEEDNSSVSNHGFKFEYERSEDISIEDYKNAFSLYQKKYEIDGYNVEIIQLQNNTEVDYDVQVTANFTDEDGTIIKTENKIVSGVSAKTSNYLVFNPGTAFSECICTLSANASNGSTYLKYMSFGAETTVYLKIDKMKNRGLPEDILPQEDEIASDIIISSEYTGDIIINGAIVFFDNNNDIASINTFNNMVVSGNDHLSVSLSYKAEKFEDHFIIPSNLEGDISYIVSFTSVKPWDGTFG